MVNTFSSINQRPVRYKWSDEEKTLIALLVRRYPDRLSKDRRASRQANARILSIWNHVNKHEFLGDGFSFGTHLKSRLLHTQINEMHRGGTGSTLWQRVMRCSAAQIQDVYSIQSAIVDAAERELAIKRPFTAPTARSDEWSDSEGDEQLESLLYDDKAENEPSNYDTKANELTVHPRQVSTDHEDMTELLRRPLSRPFLRQAHTIGKYTVRCPVLLFRGFEPTHGLKARRFADMISPIPAPPQFSSIEYRAEVHPHLERTIPYSSPFLSLAQNPINALKWVGCEDRDLAILLLQDVGEDALARYGDVGAAYPYLANSIIRQHDLNDLPGRYVGRGEFLAWGSIECSPIAVYENEDAIALHKAMKSMKEISETTGERLGPHLARVGDKYKELMAYGFLRCFKVKGYEKCPLGDDYDDFVASIYAVTRGDRAASVVSNVDPAILRASIPPTPQKGQQHEHADDKIEDESDLSNDSDSPESIQRSVYWQGVGTTSNGLRISRAGLSRCGKSDNSLASSTSPTQAAVDAQILGELGSYGFDVTQHTATATDSLFTQELLDQAAVPTPSPPPAPSIEIPENQIIDLTSSDHDDDYNTPPSRGSLSTPIKLDEEIEDEECIEVAFATRQPTSLSIRSKSLSEPIDTPTRAPKRKLATR